MECYVEANVSELAIRIDFTLIYSIVRVVTVCSVVRSVLAGLPTFLGVREGTGVFHTGPTSLFHAMISL